MPFINCTPEEWKIEATTDSEDILIKDVQDVVIARVYRQPNDTKEWCDNNAKLMRAAKEMYEALKYLIDQAQEDTPSYARTKHFDEAIDNGLGIIDRINSKFIDYED